MAGTDQLSALLEEARGGADGARRDAAYDELVRLLTSLVRARLSQQLRQRRESMDVCQSLARSFVVDLRDGKLQFDNRAALVGYLRKVVENKMIDLSRQDRAAKRGAGAAHVPIGPAETGAPAVDPGAGAPGPGTIAVEHELKDAVLARLSPDDRTLITLRQRGLEWDDIAAHLGVAAPVLRKRWSRLQQSIREALADGASA